MSIGVSSGVFSDDKFILSVVFGDQCEYVGEKAFANCENLREINDDNVIKEIGSGAFARCSNLTNIIFPELNTVGDWAFANCINLTNISLPNCSIINKLAFNFCKSLNNVFVPNLLSIGSNAFENCYNLSYIDIPKCTIIESGAFMGCQNLKSVSNIKNIEIKQNAFAMCGNLTSIDFNEIIKIGSYTFQSCGCLYNINLNKCQTIDSYAFSGCSKLTNVYLSVCEDIYESAFITCSNLSNVYINNNTTSDSTNSMFCRLHNHAFCDCDINSSICSNSNITFYFKPETIDYYKSASYWSHYSNNMVMLPKYNQIVYTFDGVGSNKDDGTLELHESFKYKYTVVDSKKINNTVILTLTKNTTDSDSDSDNNDVFDLDCIIFDKNDRNKLTSIMIPNKCKTIGEYAFDGCENLTSITLSDTLIKINKYAFNNCSSLKSLTIPNTLEYLEEGVFAGCKNIEKFEGNSEFIKNDGKAIVYNNTLICVAPKSEKRIYNISDIDNNIKTLGEYCFSECEELRRLNIPSNIKKINDYAFNNCTNLYEVHFESTTPPNINDCAFYNINDHYRIIVPRTVYKDYAPKNQPLPYMQNICPKPNGDEIIYFTTGASINLNIKDNNDNVILETVNYNGLRRYRLIKCSDTNIPSFSAKEKLTQILIGDNFQTISTEAFKNCNKLEYIYMPNSITTMENNCFSGCSELKYINIPDTITSFNTGIFNDCTNLKEFITYDKQYVSDDNRCYIKNNTLYFFAQDGNNKDNESVIIPDNVKFIYNSVFKGSVLTSVKLNTNITTIYNYAFQNCAKLNKIYYISDNKEVSGLPNNLISIGESAFGGCTNLKTINISLTDSNLNTISGSSFKNCTSLTSMILPNALTSIGESAFEGCTNLKTISISQSNSKLNTISGSSFKNCTSLISMILPNALTSIGDSAFEGCNQYIGSPTVNVGITIKNLTSIGNKCFYGTNIPKISIDSTKLKSIGESAFEGCTNLSRVLIVTAAPIQTINKKAFYGCSNIENTVTIPTTVTTIGDSAFEGCAKLTFNDTNIKYVTNIGISAFKGCESLTMIRINNSISTINESVFEGCTNLKTINISLTDSNLNTISGSSFKNCTSLTSMILPNALTSIGDSAFEGCSKFIGNFSDGLVIKENITSIGNRCFYGTNIPKLTINSTKLTSINDYAFMNCSNLSNVVIATNTQLTSIGKYAFYGCIKLSKFNSGNSGELILPNTIRRVWDYSFYGCAIIQINLKNNTSLEFLSDYCFYVNTHNDTIYPNVYVPEISSGGTPPVFRSNGYLFKDGRPIVYGAKIYVKTDIKNKYTSNDYWKKYTNYMISY